jgi:hydroxyacylglutathione hydrolase
MFVEKIVTGRWRENCYVVHQADRQALVIDPGANAEDILGLLTERELTPQAILNTHAHFDHIGAVVALKQQFDCPFYLHGGDSDLLKRANLYKIIFGSRRPVQVPSIDTDIAQLPSRFTIGPFDITWIASPGHTAGSVCFQIDDFIFTGDTLIPGARARTDLPGGDLKSLALSMETLAQLPGSLTLYGGHGKSSTLAPTLEYQLSEKTS